MKNIDVCELSTLEFENAIIKNRFIQTTNKTWIGFLDNSVTNKDDIDKILEEAPFLKEYDAILFAMDCLEGEVGLLDLLECSQNVIYALWFRRELLIKTSSFNQLLQGSTNYEFVLRAAEAGSVYVVPCSADKKVNADSLTMAYIMRKYMTVLRENGRLDNVFLDVVRLMERVGLTQDFKQAMNTFLTDSKEYEKLIANTAPCMVIVGSDICAGVLAGFAQTLADELAALGQAVISKDKKYGDYDVVS